MSNTQAVVIPFGVPIGGRGLGLGLAALVHACAHMEGTGVAIAQFHTRGKDDQANSTPSPVEAFVPPAAWRELDRDGGSMVGVVVTGAFEPPGDGDGTIQLLAFDAVNGRTRARVDAPLEEARAGASLVDAFDRLWAPLGGEIGALRGLSDLSWEGLESVLRAERCVLHDPIRGGPHDGFAALLHLGRAISEAPEARYPVERLVAIALDTAAGVSVDAKWAWAAVRALERAVSDAPRRLELVVALAALELRLGQYRDAQRRLNAALAVAPGNARLRAFLSQALRAEGNLDGALAALQSIPDGAGYDAMVCAERGMVMAARGDVEGAKAAWRVALAQDPVVPEVFACASSFALSAKDAELAQSLVDSALSAPRAHSEVLRRAVQLTLSTEAAGIARASRLARLCTRLLDLVPSDVWTSLVLARSLILLGDVPGARAQLAGIAQTAPSSSASAEADIVRFSIDNPSAEVEVRSVLRAARSASSEHLADTAARARKLATLHCAWPAWLAAAIADRRQRRWVAARGALDLALELAPGAPAVHWEMSEVLLEMHEAAGAVAHAERAVALAGEGATALAMLARALLGAGREAEARVMAARALAKGPPSKAVKRILTPLTTPARRPPGWVERMKAAFRRWRGN